MECWEGQLYRVWIEIGLHARRFGVLGIARCTLCYFPQSKGFHEDVTSHYLRSLFIRTEPHGVREHLRKTAGFKHTLLFYVLPRHMAKTFRCVEMRALIETCGRSFAHTLRDRWEALTQDSMMWKWREIHQQARVDKSFVQVPSPRNSLPSDVYTPQSSSVIASSPLSQSRDNLAAP